ncbi:hypothetical protein WSM22_06760 [Cytophagales bacterium WSM2-2]|nr:hypothetical protein WSM22_06760 [Cytophagales bacterium WSM2-2]
MASAQQNPAISLGEKISIQSNILEEQRQLFVSAPEKIPQPLPLILVFDGEGLFEPVATAVRFMNSYSEMPQMPEAIVVGVVNSDRGRDMPRPQQYGNEKGEEKFLRFLTDELLPWAKKKYPLNGHVIAIGHSQGAYFSTYLLDKSPELFSWVVAIDAPMNVDAKSEGLKQRVAKKITSAQNNSRYASIEALYGWGDQWKKYFQNSDRTMQLITKGETHESVAFRAVYDGLHFLYNDFAPARKDLKLSELQTHFESIANKYGHRYEIPYRVLMVSTSRKKLENRKQELIDLSHYMEEKYGRSLTIDNLKNAASTMTSDGAALLDYYFTLAPPTSEAIKPFLGNWSGEESRKEDPSGSFPNQKQFLKLEIVIEAGKPLLYHVDPPWAPGKKEEFEFFHVTKDGELIFGRRNRGGGVIASRSRLNAKGQLEGYTKFEGFAIPADMPEEGKKFHEFIINNPSTFELTRK